MRPFIKLVVIVMLGVLVMSCAGRRARQAEQREQMRQGQPALCAPGEAVGNTCAVQPTCKCGPPS